MYRTILFSLVIFLPLFFGCSTNNDSNQIDFGADYNVVVTDEFPGISGNELQVEVVYSGCEPNHEFALNFRQTNVNEFEVWITKITPNQDCGNEYREVKLFPLPGEIQTGRLIFVGPNERLILREE